MTYAGERGLLHFHPFLRVARHTVGLFQSSRRPRGDLARVGDVSRDGFRSEWSRGRPASAERLWLCADRLRLFLWLGRRRRRWRADRQWLRFRLGTLLFGCRARGGGGARRTNRGDSPGLRGRGAAATGPLFLPAFRDVEEPGLLSAPELLGLCRIAKLRPAALTPRRGRFALRQRWRAGQDQDPFISTHPQ